MGYCIHWVALGAAIYHLIIARYWVVCGEPNGAVRASAVGAGWALIAIAAAL